MSEEITDDATPEEPEVEEPRKMPKMTMSKVEHQVEEREKEELYDWLSGFSEHGEIQVQLTRLWPKRFKGTTVSGHLGTWDEPISDEDIHQQHGGGKFRLKVQRRDETGRFKYIPRGSRTFEIAGDPRTDSLFRDEDDDSPGSHAAQAPDSLGAQALTTMQKLVDRAAQDADSARREGKSVDFSPFIDQMNNMVRMLSSKDEKILEILSRPKDQSSDDRMFSLLERTTSGEQTRLESLRLAHDAELRQLRDFHREDISRRDDRWERDVSALHESHKRELDNLRESHKQALKSLEHGYEMRIDGLKETITRLQSDCDTKAKEIVELRAKKEKGPVESIEAIVAFRNAMEGLNPSDAGGEKGWGDRLAELGGPLIERIAGPLFAAGGGGMPAPAQLPEPMVTVRDRRTGKEVRVPQSYYQRMQAQAQAQAQAEPDSGPEDEPGVDLDPQAVATAIGYMESAYRNGIAPETFANSAKSVIPRTILEFVSSKGVDSFLDDVAKLESSSPLTTVAGRDYARKVAAYLLRGTVEAS